MGWLVCIRQCAILRLSHWCLPTSCGHSLGLTVASIRLADFVRIILRVATGTCCASGDALWLEVEAPPSLPNRCLHLAQRACAGLSFDGELFYKSATGI